MIGPSNTQGAVSRSQRNVPRKVSVRRWPWGTKVRRRSPFGSHPRSGPQLSGDARCRIVQNDFFALASGPSGFDPQQPGRRFDAILVDIDHSPGALLDERSTSFYQPDGLRSVAAHLKPGGILGFGRTTIRTAPLQTGCRRSSTRPGAEPVTFHNPYKTGPIPRRCTSHEQAPFCNSGILSSASMTNKQGARRTLNELRSCRAPGVSAEVVPVV